MIFTVGRSVEGISTFLLRVQQTEPWPGRSSPPHEAPVCANYWAPPHRSPAGPDALALKNVLEFDYGEKKKERTIVMRLSPE